MISKKKKKRSSRKEELISLPNFSEDQKKSTQKEDLILPPSFSKGQKRSLSGLKTWFYLQLADSRYFVPNHLGRGELFRGKK